MKNLKINVKNKDVSAIGFATGLVYKASRYASDMRIKIHREDSNDSPEVDLKSILGLLSLSYRDIDSFVITIEGKDEALAREELKIVIKSLLEEQDVRRK